MRILFQEVKMTAFLSKLPDSEAERYYNTLCGGLGLTDPTREQLVFWNDKFKMIRIIDNNLSGMFISSSSVGVTHLKSILKNMSNDPTIIDKVTNYIFLNKQFHSNPFLNKFGFIYDVRGELRENLKGVKDNKLWSVVDNTKPKWSFKEGIVEVFAKYPPVKKKSCETTKKLLKTILDKDNHYELFMNYASTYAFEDRRATGRPVLLLLGERGSGKGLLMDKILRKILPSLTKALPKNFKDYQNFSDCKLLIADESEGDNNALEMGKFAKYISGADIASQNEKHVGARDIVNQLFLVIASNGKPVHITERPVSPEDNQWCTLKFDTPLRQKPAFMALLKESKDLNMTLDDEIGFWVRNELFSWYLKHRKGQQHGRYGFLIPINQELRELSIQSTTDTASAFLQDIERMFNVKDMNKDLPSVINVPELRVHIDLFYTHSFLTTELISAFASEKRPVIKAGVYKNFIKKHFKYKIVRKSFGSLGRFMGFNYKKEDFEKYFEDISPLEISQDDGIDIY